MKLVAFKRQDNRTINFELLKAANRATQRSFHERHRHAYHSLILVTGGTSEQEIDFELYNLHKGQLVFIPNGAIHREIEEHEFEHTMLLFTGDFLAKPMLEMVNGFMKYVFVKPKLIIDLTDRQFQEFLKLAAVIEQEQNQEEHQNQIFILQNLLLVWLNKMESIAQQLNSANPFINNGLLFQKFVTLLDQHYLIHKDVGFYCQELNCTAKKLSQTISAITGRSTSDVIIETVLLEAKRNLCYSQLSIKEIAFNLGYENQFYFSRIFKNKVKLTPEEFRKRYAL